MAAGKRRKTKAMSQEAARRAAAQEHAENEREKNEAFRKCATAFKFWSVCGDKACERTRGCRADDAVACFRRYWDYVGEASKVLFRAAVKARCAGHSVDEAMRIAEAEVKAAAEHIAYVEARWREKIAKEKAAQASAS